MAAVPILADCLADLVADSLPVRRFTAPAQEEYHLRSDVTLVGTARA
jgi:hypothetical protein